MRDTLIIVVDIHLRLSPALVAVWLSITCLIIFYYIAIIYLFKH